MIYGPKTDRILAGVLTVASGAPYMTASAHVDAGKADDHMLQFSRTIE
jgi:hypothetical protein